MFRSCDLFTMTPHSYGRGMRKVPVENGRTVAAFRLSGSLAETDARAATIGLDLSTMQ